MINVTIENFEAEVVAASTQVPVLVDFWAPWCGPCKVIGPILEQLETEYAGRFKLVKIGSDEQQELAQAFGIRSIPTCGHPTRTGPRRCWGRATPRPHWTNWPMHWPWTPAMTKPGLNTSSC